MDVPRKEISGADNVVVPRRRFFRNAGLTIATLSAASALPLGQSIVNAASPSQALTDIDILNFALRLEHLEAEFYKLVVAGGNLSGQALTFLTTIRDHEIDHVKKLTEVISGLGGTPRGVESYNFGDVSTQASILATAEALEQTGVGAYTGAAALITNKAVLLPVAGGVEQTEARHFATIRLLRGTDAAQEAFGPSYTVQQVLDRVGPYIKS